MIKVIGTVSVTHESKAVARMRRLICQFIGHDEVLRFAPRQERSNVSRVACVCVRCGHETPGWRIA